MSPAPEASDADTVEGLLPPRDLVADMLVTLEGIDGSGKTTACEGLREAFPDAVFTREPTGSWYGDAVRRSIAADDADPIAELFLYTADHAAHLDRTIRPALDRGDLVISDRYADSRYAYQSVSIGGAVENPVDYVRGIHDPFTRVPDLTLYFDVDAETGARRSGETNKFEQIEFLRSVRDRYESLVEAEPDRFVRIDAARPPAAVRERAIEVIEGALSGA
jgi:dTMP kinase